MIGTGLRLSRVSECMHVGWQAGWAAQRSGVSPRASPGLIGATPPASAAAAAPPPPISIDF